MHMSERLLFSVGALFGAAGVALSAVAAHRIGGDLGTAASFLLIHAPALLVLSSARFGNIQIAGGWAIVVGLALFCGDLVARTFLGTRLFPMAAPAGGLLLMGGWVLVALAALLNRRASA
jgi:uncharacterized membrane protein YgdD (TMEM256/DUF423 family)